MNPQHGFVTGTAKGKIASPPPSISFPPSPSQCVGYLIPQPTPLPPPTYLGVVLLVQVDQPRGCSKLGDDDVVEVGGVLRLQHVVVHVDEVAHVCADLF